MSYPVATNLDDAGMSGGSVACSAVRARYAMNTSSAAKSKRTNGVFDLKAPS
jgi:hypothetical protein